MQPVDGDVQVLARRTLRAFPVLPHHLISSFLRPSTSLLEVARRGGRLRT